MSNGGVVKCANISHVVINGYESLSVCLYSDLSRQPLTQMTSNWGVFLRTFSDDSQHNKDEIRMYLCYVLQTSLHAVSTQTHMLLFSLSLTPSTHTN